MTERSSAAHYKARLTRTIEISEELKKGRDAALEVAEEFKEKLDKAEHDSQDKEDKIHELKNGSRRQRRSPRRRHHQGATPI